MRSRWSAWSSMEGTLHCCSSDVHRRIYQPKQQPQPLFRCCCSVPRAVLMPPGFAASSHALQPSRFLHIRGGASRGIIIIARTAAPAHAAGSRSVLRISGIQHGHSCTKTRRDHRVSYRRAPLLFGQRFFCSALSRDLFRKV